MAIITKRILSSSVQGSAISVTGTAASGSLIHTAVSGTSSIDEVWLWAVNGATAGKKLTINWGTSGGGGFPIEFTVPPEDGPYLVVPGFPLQNSRMVRAYAATASVVSIMGYVHRIV